MHTLSRFLRRAKHALTFTAVGAAGVYFLDPFQGATRRAHVQQWVRQLPRRRAGRSISGDASSAPITALAGDTP